MDEKFVKIRKNDLKKLSGWDLMVYATLNSFFFPDRELIYTSEDFLLEFMNVNTSKNKARDKGRIRHSLEILQSLEYITFYQKDSILICDFLPINEEFIMLQTDVVKNIVNTPLEIREKQNLLKVYISIYSRFSLNGYAYPGISTIAQDVGLSNSTTFKMIELLQKFGLMHISILGLSK